MRADQLERDPGAGRHRAPAGAASSWIDVVIAAAAVGAMALTVWLSLGPALDGPGSDKDLHALAYFVDTFAILLAVVWRPGRPPGSRAGWAPPIALVLLAVGGVIELAQGGFVHRDAQLGDWVADGVGIGAALVAFGTLRWAFAAGSRRRAGW
jgi:hypothetical protein